MNVCIECDNCNNNIDLETELDNISSSERLEVLEYLINDVYFGESPNVFFLPKTIQEELKMKALEKLYNQLTLEQIEKIVDEHCKKF